MRNLFLFTLALLTSARVLSQVPQGINYQAVARDNSGNILSNQNIAVKFSIHDSSSGGLLVYSETQAVTTNQFGLFTSAIGKGTVVSGTFNAVDWSTGNKFLQVEIDLGGGFVNMGTSELLSVPFAFYAASGNPGTQGPPGPQGIQGPAGSANFNGTANYLTKFLTANSGGNSQVYDNGTTVFVGPQIPYNGILLQAIRPDSTAFFGYVFGSANRFGAIEGGYDGSGSGAGMVGYSLANNGDGTVGEYDGIVGSGNGVRGTYFGFGSGDAVQGIYNSTALGNGNAVAGYSYSDSSSGGVLGFYSGANHNLPYGVYGYCDSSASMDRMIGVLGSYNTTHHGIGVAGIGFSGSIPTTVNATSQYDVGVLGSAPSGVAAVYADGDQVATGAKSGSVPTSKGNQLLYAMESPGIWFEDFGVARLINGEVTVSLDPLFLETVVIDQTHPLLVFVQANGEKNDLYVEPGTTSFTVHGNPGSSTGFSYRVTAKRINYQDHRFGADLVQGKGDSRSRFHYVTPKPVDYDEAQKSYLKNKTDHASGSGIPIPASKGKDVAPMKVTKK